MAGARPHPCSGSTSEPLIFSLSAEFTHGALNRPTKPGDIMARSSPTPCAVQKGWLEMTVRETLRRDLTDRGGAPDASQHRRASSSLPGPRAPRREQHAAEQRDDDEVAEEPGGNNERVPMPCRAAGHQAEHTRRDSQPSHRDERICPRRRGRTQQRVPGATERPCPPRCWQQERFRLARTSPRSPDSRQIRSFGLTRVDA